MEYNPPNPLYCAIHGVCPRCGGDKIFSSFMVIKDQCAKCGLRLRDHDCGDGPATFAIFALGIVAVPAAIWVHMVFAMPWWGHALLWAPILLVATMGCLPALKSWLIAQEYKNHILSGQFDSSDHD